MPAHTLPTYPGTDRSPEVLRYRNTAPARPTPERSDGSALAPSPAAGSRRCRHRRQVGGSTRVAQRASSYVRSTDSPSPVRSGVGRHSLLTLSAEGRRPTVPTGRSALPRKGDPPTARLHDFSGLPREAHASGLPSSTGPTDDKELHRGSRDMTKAADWPPVTSRCRRSSSQLAAGSVSTRLDRNRPSGKTLRTLMSVVVARFARQVLCGVSHDRGARR